MFGLLPAPMLPPPDMEDNRLSLTSLLLRRSASRAISACSAFFRALRSAFARCMASSFDALMSAFVPAGSSLSSSSSPSLVASGASSSVEEDESSLPLCRF